MADLAHGTQQEFWRPPAHRVGDDIVLQAPVPTMAEACLRCGTEFLLGSHFCHACGGRRPDVTAAHRADAAVIAGWWEKGVRGMQSAIGSISWRKMKFPAWLRYLHFHEIKARTGLSAGSLIAFVLGMACVAGALLVGLLTAKTLVDWQAIQFYRAEWLLAATCAFVAGILFKKSSQDHRD